MTQAKHADLDDPLVDELNQETLSELGLHGAEAVVGLLDDENNHRVSELAYEHFGTRTVVVRVHERDQIPRFDELGVLVVDPNVAMVSMLDHFVRSPTGASLLMGTHTNQDVLDVELLNPERDGARVKDLRLPGDTLVLSLR